MDSALTPRELKKEIVFCVLILVVGLGCTVQSYTYDDGSSHFPRFLSITLVLLMVVDIFRILGLRRRVSGQDCGTPLLKDPWLFMTGKVLVAVGLYVLSLPVVGYYVSTVLFLFLTMLGFSLACKKEEYPWLNIAVSIVIFLALVYGLFNVFLSTSMPQGFLL